MKLRTKILSYTLPLILIPFLLTALAVYYFVIRANEIEIQEAKRQSLNEVLVNVGKEIDSARRDIALLSNVPAIANYLQNSTGNQEKQARTVLELFFKQNPYYLQLSLVDESGQEKIRFSKIPKQQDLQSVKNKDYFRRTLILGSVQTPVIEIQPEKYATIFTKSIAKENFMGMLVLVLNTEVFERAMRPLLKRDLATFLFDDRGVVLASAFNPNDDKFLLNEIKLAVEARELLENSSFDTNQKTIGNSNKKYLLSFLPSESFLRVNSIQKQTGENWFLGVLEPQKSNFIPTNFQIFFFSLLFLAVGAVLWVVAKASKRITVPLEKVSIATNKIARGDTELNLDIKTGDEVEDLANSVKKMNRELQNYQKQLVQTAKLAAMGEMTSEISHEIQNRISGISLWLQHLDAEMEKSDPRQEYLDEMKQGLSGFMEMLANLKMYYKTPVLDLKDVDLNLLVRETLPFVQEKIKENKIAIKTEFSADLVFIKGDVEKLKSVILNLLLNAVEAVKENGKIEVKTALENGNVLFSVSDNGSGIDENDQMRIFFPFYSTKSGGSGLGLAISSNIIAAHKGRIEVESEVERGTTFRVFLPIGTQAARLHKRESV